MGIGCGSIVAATNAGGVPQLLLAIAWFLAVAIPVFAFAKISGAHLNPAVTLALLGSGRFPAKETVPFVLAQLAGAFVGAGLVLVTLGGSAHLGATLPAGDELLRTFVMELGFTVALLASVLYLTHPGRELPRWQLILPPTVVGFSTFFIGPFTGSSLNPARTLAPAVLSGDYLGIWVYFLSAGVAVALGAVVGRLAAPVKAPRKGEAARGASTSGGTTSR